MAIFNAAAAKAAAALQAQAAKAAAQQKAAAANAASVRGAAMAAPKPQTNIPPAIRGAQGNDVIMNPRSAATTGGPKPAPISAYNPKEGVGVTASTPRPLMGGQGNDVMMGSPSTNTGIAPARSAATVIKKKGGSIKAKSSYSSGGKVGSASKRADGCAQRGKTKGRMV